MAEERRYSFDGHGCEKKFNRECIAETAIGRFFAG